jgi:hypothetical protein
MAGSNPERQDGRRGAAWPSTRASTWRIDPRQRQDGRRQAAGPRRRDPGGEAAAWRRPASGRPPRAPRLSPWRINPGKPASPVASRWRSPAPSWRSGSIPQGGRWRSPAPSVTLAGINPRLDVPCGPMPGRRYRHGGERGQHKGRRSAARPSTRRATAPGPMPVARSAARPSMPARWRAAPASSLRRLLRIRTLPSVQRDEFSLCTSKFESDMLSHADSLRDVSRRGDAFANMMPPAARIFFTSGASSGG